MHVDRLLGNYLLSDLTEDRLRSYMTARTGEGVGGRTVNMEVSLLARAIGRTWKVLWPKLKRYEEPKDTGRALTFDEEDRLLKAAAKSGSPVIESFIRALLLTAMRSGELANMTWAQVDFAKRLLTVGKAKTQAGTGRQSPMNNELFELLTEHARWFTERFGDTLAEHYLFPGGRRWPDDPIRPTTTFKKGWTKFATWRV